MAECIAYDLGTPAKLFARCEAIQLCQSAVASLIAHRVCLIPLGLCSLPTDNTYFGSLEALHLCSLRAVVTRPHVTQQVVPSGSHPRKRSCSLIRLNLHTPTSALLPIVVHLWLTSLLPDTAASHQALSTLLYSLTSPNLTLTTVFSTSSPYSSVIIHIAISLAGHTGRILYRQYAN